MFKTKCLESASIHIVSIIKLRPRQAKGLCFLLCCANIRGLLCLLQFEKLHSMSSTLRSNCAVSMDGGRSYGTVCERLPPLIHSSFIIKSSYCLAEPHNLSFSRTPHHDLTSSFCQENIFLFSLIYFVFTF